VPEEAELAKQVKKVITLRKTGLLKSAVRKPRLRILTTVDEFITVE